MIVRPERANSVLVRDLCELTPDDIHSFSTSSRPCPISCSHQGQDVWTDRSWSAVCFLSEAHPGLFLELATQTPAPSDDSYPSLASMSPTLTATTTMTTSTVSNSSPAPYALNPHSLQLTTRPPPTYRGVFTSPLQTLPAGTLIETAPVLVIPAHEWEFGKKTALDHYAFVWGRRGDMAVAFGLGAFPFSLSSSLHLRRTPFRPTDELSS